jgi:DNA-binding LytR/AlgR family response regulator
LTSVNLRDVVTIDSNSLLYIATAENYIELNWFENGQTKKMLLRNTLAEVEKEIKKQFCHIQRCHNSYIVNVNQIRTISGNSGGYRIILNNIDFSVPISRKYKNDFFKLLTGSTL